MKTKTSSQDAVMWHQYELKHPSKEITKPFIRATQWVRDFVWGEHPRLPVEHARSMLIYELSQDNWGQAHVWITRLWHFINQAYERRWRREP